MTPADAPATGQRYSQADLFDHEAAANLWGGPPTVAEADEPQAAPQPRTDGTAEPETGQTSQALHPEPSEPLPFPPPRNADDIDRWHLDVMRLIEQRIKRPERRDAMRRIVARMIYRARKDPAHDDFGALWWSISKLIEQAQIVNGYERSNKSDKPETVRRRFRRATLDLVQLGVIQKKYRYEHDGRQTTNRYSLRWTRWKIEAETEGGGCVSPLPQRGKKTAAEPQLSGGRGTINQIKCPPLKETTDSYKNFSTKEAQPAQARAHEADTGKDYTNQFATDHERPSPSNTPGGADEQQVIDGQAVYADRRGQRDVLRKARGRTLSFAAAAQAAMNAQPQGDVGDDPESWFRAQGVVPRNCKRLASIARRDPDRFADVVQAIEGGGSAGPGLIHGWMTGAQPMPHHVADEFMTYDRARFCSRCHVDPCQCEAAP